MKYTHLIWDFNGTILDDVAVGIASANVLLGKRGLPLIETEAAYKAHFGFPVIDYYKILGFDFTKESYDDVAVEWVKEYLARVPQAGIYAGVRETMEKVKAHGTPQILLSATQLDMLRRQVEGLGLSNVFAEIYGLGDVHAKSKRMLAERLREKHPNGRFLFIGDTDHDLEVARAAGGDAVLFSGGHQSRERLERLGCPVVDSAEEILTYLL